MKKTIYLIGDIQGCFNSLMYLLETLRFNPHEHLLGFTGDLVNRGPDSEKVLDFMMKLQNPIVVLGNHDLYMMLLYFQKKLDESPTLIATLHHHDLKKWIDWLLVQPLMHLHTDFSLVHAGIPPQWDIQTAYDLGIEASHTLQKNPEAFFNHLFGDQPTKWADDLEGHDRTRYIVNALTRMRFCTQSGEVDLTNKSNTPINPSFKPWFEFRNSEEKDIIFGHWASLEGKSTVKHIHAIDTGCVWGNTLTAIEIPSKKLIAVKSQEKAG